MSLPLVGMYRELVVAAFLSKEKRVNSKSAIITSEIHKGLEERLNDSNNSFLGFWDAHQWVEKTYDVKVSYQLLWHYKTHKLDATLKISKRSKYQERSKSYRGF